MKRKTTNGIKGFHISSADINGGSSGGACFNSKGELIGIIYGGLGTAASVVPINDIRKALAG